MASLSIILYKLKDPLNPDSLVEEGSEHIIAVGTQGDNITIGDCIYSFTVDHFNLEKKVYSPGKLTFQLNVTDICDKNDSSKTIAASYSLCPKLVSFFAGYYLKLKKTETDAAKASAAASYACSNFYIYDVTPEFSRDKDTSTIRLLMTAYSADHKLTLQKFNRSHTSQKFIADVVAPDLAKDGLLEKCGVQFRKKYLQFIANYQKTVTNKTDGSQSESFEETEIVQPYMVQYDETYYNFLARTANRCGEFLFFEDGALTVGLDEPLFSKLAEINYDSDTKKDLISGITFRKLETVDSPEPYYPQVMQESGAKVNYADKGYVQDVKSGNDEFLNTMQKGKWVDMWKDIYIPCWPGKVTGLMTELLNNQTIGEMIVNLTMTESMEMASAAVYAKKYNDTFDKEFWNKYATDDKKDGNKSYMFTSDDSKWNENLSNVLTEFNKKLSLKFYHELLKYEQEAGTEAVTIKTGVICDTDVKLGKIVRFEGKRYVVVAITGHYRQASSEEEYSFTAIPVREYDTTLQINYKTSSGGATNASEDTATESVTAYLVVPPLYEHGHVCHSAMQRAYVVTNKDPQFLCRVQIKYPWQTEDDKDAPSPFIRMAKDFAGEDCGITFMPEEETEVLVDYEGGNVERPFVVGSLHNRVATPQPEDRSIKSRNGHKIVFDDPTDGTKMFWEMFGASGKLLTQTFPVPGWGPQARKAEEINELSGGIELSDEYGFYKVELSTHKRSITIDSPFGTVDVNAFTGISINAPNGDIRLNGKNIILSASNELLIESGTQIEEKLEGLTSRNSAKQFGKNIVGALLAQFANLVIPDVSLLRAIVEAFIKPCNGTLRIKSYRYLLLEAGADGYAQIPRNAYKVGKEPKPAKFADRIIDYNKEAEPIRNLITAFQGNKDKAVSLLNAYNAVCEARTKLLTAVTDKSIAVDLQGTQPEDQAKTIAQNALSAGADPAKIPKLKPEAQPTDANATDINTGRTEIINTFTAAMKAFKAFDNLKNNKDANGNALAGDQQTNPQVVDGQEKTRLWNYMKPSNESFEQKLDTYNAGDTDADKITVIKKILDSVNAGLNNLCAYKLSYNGAAGTPAELIESIDWKHSNVRGVADFVMDALEGNPLVDWIADAVVNGLRVSRPWVNDSHDKGQILFSDSNTHYGLTVPLSSIPFNQANHVDSINTLPTLKNSLRQIYL